MSNHKNCISYWFPRLQGSGVQVPKTEIVKTKIPLIELLDGKTPEEGIVEFADELLRALRNVAYCGRSLNFPAFLRSGDFSGKHCWRRTCYIEDVAHLEPMDLIQHVAAILEDGECQNVFGFPWDVWAAREYLHPAHDDVAFEAEQFSGFPVRREFRAFVTGQEIHCLHPYWPPDAFTNLSDENRAKLAKISEMGEDEENIRWVACTAGESLPGSWSVDILHANQGWFVTDCAIAKDSWHWAGCPNA